MYIAVKVSLCDFCLWGVKVYSFSESHFATIEYIFRKYNKLRVYVYIYIHVYNNMYMTRIIYIQYWTTLIQNDQAPQELLRATMDDLWMVVSPLKWILSLSASSYQQQQQKTTTTSGHRQPQRGPNMTKLPTEGEPLSKWLSDQWIRCQL